MSCQEPRSCLKARRAGLLQPDLLPEIKFQHYMYLGVVTVGNIPNLLVALASLPTGKMRTLPPLHVFLRIKVKTENTEKYKHKKRIEKPHRAGSGI